ncbi:mitochondrial thiamine pyrophosphate transporter, partial [Terramyces sp. JEL0728]
NTISSTIPKSLHTFTSGAASGITATLITFPFDLLRTRFAVQGNMTIYNSIYGAVVDIHKLEGYRGFYRGIIPSVIQIIPQMGLVFESYRFLKQRYATLEETNPKLKPYISGWKDLICGGVAGMFSKACTMLFDVIRKRLQVQGPVRNEIIISDVPKHTGLISTARGIVVNEGFLALFKGIWPSMLKAAPSSAVTFFIVGQCHAYFKKVNERSL